MSQNENNKSEKSIEKQKKKELYVELKTLDENIKELHVQIEKIEEQISELKTNKAILEKFTELKEGKEIRVPLVSGIYIKAELKDTKKVMVNVGADVTVEKTPEEVSEILANQINELIEYRKNLVMQIKSMIQRAEEIQEYFKNQEN